MVACVCQVAQPSLLDAGVKLVELSNAHSTSSTPLWRSSAVPRRVTTAPLSVPGKRSPSRGSRIVPNGAAVSSVTTWTWVSAWLPDWSVQRTVSVRVEVGVTGMVMACEPLQDEPYCGGTGAEKVSEL